MRVNLLFKVLAIILCITQPVYSSFTISGTAVTAPTAAGNSIVVDGSFDPDFIYFIFRTHDKLNFQNYLPYYDNTAGTFSAAVSRAIRLNLVNPTHGDGTTANFLWSATHSNKIYLWRGLADGYTVTTFPPGQAVKGPYLGTSLPFSGNADFKTARITHFTQFQTTFGNVNSYYGSILVTNLVSIKVAGPVLCSLRVVHRGKGNFYVDGKMIGISNSIFEDADAVFVSDSQLRFSQGRYSLIQVYGVSLEIKSIELIECLDANTNAFFATSVPVDVNSLVEDIMHVTTPTVPSVQACNSFDSNCVSCNQEACFMCTGGLTSFGKGCTNYAYETHKTQSELGSINIPYLDQLYFMRNFQSPAGQSITANLFYIGQAHPANSLFYAIAFEGGAYGDLPGLLPRRFTTRIVIKSITSTSLSITASASGNNPLSLFVIRVLSSDFGTSNINFHYAQFLSKPLPYDIFSTGLTSAIDSVSVYAGNWYYIIAYYKPGTNGNKITFTVPTTLPVESYINGESFVTEPSSGVASAVLTPTQTADYFVVIHIVYASTGAFQRNDALVTDPTQLALAHSGQNTHLLEYHLCPGSLFFDKTTLKCVNSCPPGTYQSKNYCVNPCKQYKFSGSSVVQCAMQYLQGAAVDYPTGQQDPITLQNADLTNGMTYFVTRHIPYMYFSNFLGTTTISGALIASRFRKLNPFSTNQATGFTASLGYNSPTTSNLQVWSTRPGGWLFTALPSDCRVSGFFVSATACSHTTNNGIRVANLDSIEFGDPWDGKLPYSLQDYYTIVASRLIGLRNTNPDSSLMCRIQFTYNGILHIYLDLAKTDVTPYVAMNTQGYYTTESRFLFNTTDFRYLQVYTRETTAFDMEIVDCVLTTNDNINYLPEFEVYSPVEVVAEAASSTFIQAIPAQGGCQTFDDSYGFCHKCPVGKCVDISTGDCLLIQPTITIYDELGNDITPGGLTLSSITMDVSNVLEIKHIECLSKITTAQWTQTGGPTLDINQFITTGSNTSLLIPYCRLQPQTTYTYELTLYDYTSGSFNIILQITTNSITAGAYIVGGNRNHPAGLDMVLAASYSSSCAFMPYYKWKCMTPSQFKWISCPDPQGIYGLLSSSNQLVVPKSYLTSQDFYTITLEVYSGAFYTIDTANITITGSTPFNISISCLNCKDYFSPSDEIILEATLLKDGLDFNLHKFDWGTFPPFKMYSFQNRLKVYPSYEANPFHLFISDLQVHNSINRGYGVFQLPYNQPPRGGTFTVSSTVGFSMSTIFVLTCSLWIDEDLPLSYQFAMSYSEDPDTFFEISIKNTTSTLDTFLSAYPTNPNAYLKAKIFDALDIRSEVSLPIQIFPIDVSTSLDTIRLILDILPSAPSSLHAIQACIIVGKEFSNLELGIIQAASMGCPTCSGHGKCVNQECVCDPDWTINCYYARSDLNEIIQLKKTLINIFSSNYASLGTSEYRRIAIQLVSDLSNPEFNNNESMTMLQNLLKNQLAIDKPTTKLSMSEAKLMLSIIDNFMRFFLENGCSYRLDVTNSFSNSLIGYFEAISKAFLDFTLPNEQRSFFLMNTFDFSVQKVTLCEFGNGINKTSSDAPVVEITPLITPPEICGYNDTYDIVFYAFRESLLACDKTLLTIKDVLGLSIVNAYTGVNSLDKFALSYLIPDGYVCRGGCVRNETRACVCANINDFEYKAQLAKLLFDFDRFSGLDFEWTVPWRAAHSFVFWVIFGFSLNLFISSIVLLLFPRLENFCIFEDFKREFTGDSLKVFGIMFVV